MFGWMLFVFCHTNTKDEKVFWEKLWEFGWQIGSKMQRRVYDSIILSEKIKKLSSRWVASWNDDVWWAIRESVNCTGLYRPLPLTISFTLVIDESGTVDARLTGNHSLRSKERYFFPTTATPKRSYPKKLADSVQSQRQPSVHRIALKREPYNKNVSLIQKHQKKHKLFQLWHPMY
jgi:hypothetical protein